MTIFQRGKKRIAAVLCALGLGAAASAASAQTVDLVANNAGPSTSAAGAAFTYVVRLSNNGPAAAHGETFVDTMPEGATGVTASCTASGGGAVCPAGAALVVANDQVSGSIAVFPNQGSVEITVKGFYAIPSNSSVSSVTTLTAPAGVTESKPITNTSQVNTTMINDTKMEVSKTAVTNNGVMTYTVVIKNVGNLNAANELEGAAVDGVLIADYLNANYQAAGYASVNVVFKSCTPAGNAVCPANSNFPNRNFRPRPGYTQDLFRRVVVPKLPLGGSITVVYDAVITPNTTQCGLRPENLMNVAEIQLPTGITNQFGNARAEAGALVPGTADCPPIST